MSGGSFNYICFKEIDELFGREDEIERMAKELLKLGFESYSQITLEVLHDMKLLQLIFNAKQPMLGDVWKAIEWWHSGDIGKEDAIKKINEIIEKGRAKKS